MLKTVRDTFYCVYNYLLLFKFFLIFFHFNLIDGFSVKTSTLVYDFKLSYWCCMSLFCNILFIGHSITCVEFLFSIFVWTFLWMHLAVGYLCHTLSVFSNRLMFGSSCQSCLFFLDFFLSVFRLHVAYHRLFC